MNAMTRAYLTAALWTGTVGEDGDPMDDTYGLDDVAPASIAKAETDCRAFVERAGPDADAYADTQDSGEWSAEEKMGHDFWLTRNGHGVGFWDRDLGELGDRLTALAHSFGETDAYVGDDGLVYLTGGEG